MDHIGVDVHRKESQICILAEGTLLFLALRAWFCERLPSRQHDVVEIHARRARDVDLLDQLEPEDTKSHPWQIRVVADRQPNRKRYKLGSNRTPWIKRSGEQDIDVEVTESFDAERLGRHLTIARDSIPEALQTEALPVKRTDVDPVELVWIPQVLSLEAGGEISRVEMRTLEIAFACANLRRPERLDQECLLDKTRVRRPVARLEGQ